jgi:hypothetical protein
MGRHESGTAGAVGKNHFNTSENSLVKPDFKTKSSSQFSSILLIYGVRIDAQRYFKAWYSKHTWSSSV